MNTLQYLDAVKEKLNVESDYAVAKALKIRTSTIYGYRGRGGQMDDDVAVKVADLLKIHPGLVVLDMHRERAKTPAERVVWTDIFEGFRAPLLHANRARGIPLPR